MAKSTSPKISKTEIVRPQEMLDFPLAIAEVIAGRKISRQEWQNKEYYGVLSDGRLKLHKSDGQFYDWIVTDGDLQSEDWVVI